MKQIFLKYPYIYAWGKLMGSTEGYITEQCLRAEKDFSPCNSVYFNGEVWIATNSIRADLLERLNKLVPEKNN
jgi:hypothetical protein